MTKDAQQLAVSQADTGTSLDSPAPLSRTSALWIVTVMLAIPAAYLFAAWPRGHAATASGEPATTSAAQIDLSQLETRAQSNPTEANRINLSQAYISEGMQGRAIGVLSAFVKERPLSALGWNNLCVAHMMQQEFNLAISACEAGIRVDGTMSLLRNNLKWAEAEQTKVMLLLAAEEKVSSKDRDAEFYLNHGLNQLHLGLYDEAIDSWGNCLKLDPRNARARNNVGVGFMMKGQPLSAEASFREALAIDPSNALYMNNLKWALSKTK